MWRVAMVKRVLSRAVLLLVSLSCGTSLALAANSPGALPKFFLIIRQRTEPGKTSARQQLETQMARAFDAKNLPIYWIEMESLTGEPGSLLLEPFDTFEDLENANKLLTHLYSGSAGLADLYQQMDELIVSSETTIAVQRNDLSYRPYSIDLSKARSVRIYMLRTQMDNEAAGEDLIKRLSTTYEQINAPGAWAVYEVNAGMPQPAFIVVEPMNTLKDADNELTFGRVLGRMQRGQSVMPIMQSLTEMESDIYSVNADMSHVSKEFAEGDPSFWSKR